MRRAQRFISRRVALGLAAFISAAGLVSAQTSTPQVEMLAPRIYFAGTPTIQSSSHFQMVSESNAATTRGMGDVLESLYGSFYSEFGKLGFELVEPKEPLVWIFFGNESSFRSYARETDRFEASWLKDYYSPRTNRVAICSGHPDLVKPAGLDSQSSASRSSEDILNISHEAAHQFSYSSGLLVAGVMYPVWLSEGLATHFETHDILSAEASDRTNDRSNARLPRLMRAHRLSLLVPLERFVVMARFRPDEGYDLADVYAQSQGLFQFLLLRRADSLKTYLSNLSELGWGERKPDQLLQEFTRSFGAIEPLEIAWHSYLTESDTEKP